MKIQVTVDLDALDTETGTVGEWVENIIKDDIHRQLKKSAEYKTWIENKAKQAIKSLK